MENINTNNETNETNENKPIKDVKDVKDNEDIKDETKDDKEDKDEIKDFIESTGLKLNLLKEKIKQNPSLTQLTSDEGTDTRRNYKNSVLVINNSFLNINSIPDNSDVFKFIQIKDVLNLPKLVIPRFKFK